MIFHHLFSCAFIEFHLRHLCLPLTILQCILATPRYCLLSIFWSRFHTFPCYSCYCLWMVFFTLKNPKSIRTWLRIAWRTIWATSKPSQGRDLKNAGVPGNSKVVWHQGVAHFSNACWFVKKSVIYPAMNMVAFGRLVTMGGITKPQHFETNCIYLSKMEWF